VPPPGGPGVASFFDRIRSYGAVRPDDGRWFAGVAAALARRWGVDPLLVRGGFVILTLFGGVGLLLYGLGWLFLPHPDGRIHAQEVLRGTVTPGFVGGLLCVLLDLGGSGWSRGGWHVGPHPFGGGLLLVGLVVFAVWWFAGGRHRGSGLRGHGWGGPSGSGWGGRGWGGPGEGGSGGPGGPGSGGPGGGWYGPTTPGGPGAGTSGTTPPADPAEPGPPPSSGGTGGGTRGGTGGGTGSGTTPGSGDDMPPYGTPPPPPPAPPAPSAPPAPPGAQWSTWPSATWSDGPQTYGTGATAALVRPPAPPHWASRPDLHRPSHALTSAVLGAALLGGAVVVALNPVLARDTPVVALAAAVALAIVAAGIVAAGVAGRRAGGLAPAGIVLAVVTLAATASHGTLSWAGGRTWTPTTLPAGRTSYDLGVGNARLDLRQASVPGATAASPAEVDVRVGVGNLVVVVPSGLAVRVVGTTGAGNVDNAAALAATTGGTAQATSSRRGPHVDIDVQSAANPVLVVHADVGLGNLTIDGPNS
jgi:phage shock protein PspC (stress-responsive transcriptional regulator)